MDQVHSTFNAINGGIFFNIGGMLLTKTIQVYPGLNWIHAVIPISNK